MGGGENGVSDAESNKSTPLATEKNSPLPLRFEKKSHVTLNKNNNMPPPRHNRRPLPPFYLLPGLRELCMLL